VVILLLVIAWTVLVAMRPAEVTSGGGHYCASDPVRIGYCTDAAVPSPTPRFTQGLYDIVCPGVSGGTGPALCSKGAQAAVLAAVANVGFPITRITFQRGTICLTDPFSMKSTPCASGLPAGTTDVGSAIVTFSGTPTEGLINVGFDPAGQVVTRAAVLAPPASPTPTTQP
jgi:hypothetical protein